MNPTITIERVGLEGQGVGYDLDGNIYFVPGAIPGDRVRISVEGGKRRYRDAALEEIIEPSPDRTPSPCPHFTQCGGCDFLHWKYPAQLQAKESLVRHVLARGGFSSVPILPIRGARETEGYRTRVQVRQVGGRVGFFRKHSHDIVPIEHCLVAHPKLNEALAELRARPTNRPEKIELTWTGERVHSVRNREHGAQGFQQIHLSQNAVLREEVVLRIQRRSARRVLELFSGNGNLTFAYLSSIEAVLGVEFNREAVASAEALRSDHPFGARAAFLRAGVDGLLRDKLPPEFKERYDTLVLDPPRSGAGKALSQLCHSNLKNLVYVSCSPVTFVQDLHGLRTQGFSLEEVQPIDMFPHTKHVELVALLTRD